ncbi:hypothetical protein GCM10012284_58780 [Mangrovihabitans endophyticus]|uniref:Helix-turn-helix domain-containing protein n=1 Tax=Mangrovihabitans endophyticus TaxID=1751298 RepID=A0A8J3C6I1_9ACTN|nr:hypothetical protein GCM10012284_58780 [Mangrovihabitans endophyticus]
MEDRLKHGGSGMIPAVYIGTPQGARDLGSAWLSAGRAKGRSHIDPRTVANTAPQHREAITVRLRAVDSIDTTTAETELITTEELARMLRVDPSSVRRWRTARPLQGPPFIALSERVIMYSIEDVRAWLASRRVTPEAA